MAWYDSNLVASIVGALLTIVGAWRVAAVYTKNIKLVEAEKDFSNRYHELKRRRHALEHKLSNCYKRSGRLERYTLEIDHFWEQYFDFQSLQYKFFREDLVSERSIVHWMVCRRMEAEVECDDCLSADKGLRLCGGEIRLCIKTGWYKWLENHGASYPEFAEVFSYSSDMEYAPDKNKIEQYVNSTVDIKSHIHEFLFKKIKERIKLMTIALMMVFCACLVFYIVLSYSQDGSDIRKYIDSLK